MGVYSCPDLTTHSIKLKVLNCMEGKHLDNPEKNNEITVYFVPGPLSRIYFLMNTPMCAHSCTLMVVSAQHII